MFKKQKKQAVEAVKIINFEMISTHPCVVGARNQKNTTLVISNK